MDAEGALAALDTMNTQEVTYTEFLAAMVSGQDRFKDDSCVCLSLGRRVLELPPSLPHGPDNKAALILAGPRCVFEVAC